MSRIAIGILVVLVGFAAAWNHDKNGDDWPADPKYPLCKGTTRQSPQDIKTASTTKKPIGPLIFSADYLTPINIHWTNTGHDAKAKVDDIATTDRTVKLATEKDPKNIYVLEQFHFHHEGLAKVGGAEHLIDGKRYPAEIHFVHYKKEYGSVSAALTPKTKGENTLLVIGVFVESFLGPAPKTTNRWPANIGRVSNPTSKRVSKEKFSFKEAIMNNINMNAFYNYEGSLTTPTCNPVVQWIVMKEPIKLAPGVLLKLRQLKDDRGMNIQNNYRNVQNPVKEIFENQ